MPLSPVGFTYLGEDVATTYFLCLIAFTAVSISCLTSAESTVAAISSKFLQDSSTCFSASFVSSSCFFELPVESIFGASPISCLDSCLLILAFAELALLISVVTFFFVSAFVFCSIFSVFTLTGSFLFLKILIFYLLFSSPILGRSLL